MEHAKILSLVGKAISSNVEIVAVSRIDKINVTKDDVDIVPGKKTVPGKYGVVELRLMISLDESV